MSVSTCLSSHLSLSLSVFLSIYIYKGDSDVHWYKLICVVYIRWIKHFKQWATVLVIIVASGALISYVLFLSVLFESRADECATLYNSDRILYLK